MILRLALRFSFSASGRHRSRAVRIMISTTLSVAVLITVIAIMNYLQGSRLTAIRDVRSFDAVVDGRFADEFSSRFPSCSVFEYAEVDALLDGRAVVIRYIDDDYDGGIEIEGDLSSIVVPRYLSRNSVDIMMMARGRSGVMMPMEETYSVSGLYSSHMGYEFDSNYLFLPLQENTENVKTAIKNISEKAVQELREEGYSVTTWKEAESGLYSAFLIEKVLMHIVLTLLFVVILTSERSSMRIFLEAKRRDRAGLETLGYPKTLVWLSLLISFILVIVLALILGIALSSLCLPISEFAMQSFGFYNVKLSFPVETFIYVTLLLIAAAVIIAFFEERHESRYDILEVIHGE